MLSSKTTYFAGSWVSARAFTSATQREQEHTWNISRYRGAASSTKICMTFTNMAPSERSCVLVRAGGGVWAAGEAGVGAAMGSFCGTEESAGVSVKSVSCALSSCKIAGLSASWKQGALPKALQSEAVGASPPVNRYCHFETVKLGPPLRSFPWCQEKRFLLTLVPDFQPVLLLKID